MADVYEECGECDGKGEVVFRWLGDDQQERVLSYYDGDFEPEDDDLVWCPVCKGEGEVHVGWRESPWQAGGFDSREDWEDNMF